jgi:hypothetical protein
MLIGDCMIDITPEEIEEVKTIGTLNGDDVKVLKTYGGLCVAVGKKDKKSKNPEALAASSHTAITSFQVEKMYGSSFEPAIFKSESEQPPEVTDKSNILPDMMKNAGMELFSINKFNNLDVVLVKHGLEIAKCQTAFEDSSLVIKNQSQRQGLSPNKTISDLFSIVIKEEMKKKNIKKVVNNVQ